MALARSREPESRREAVRVGCNVAAKISFNDVELCDAIIKDISTTGLRLFVPNKAWLPSEFEVMTSMIGRPLRVRTSWTDGDMMGVEFIFNRKPGQAL